MNSLSDEDKVFFAVDVSGKPPGIYQCRNLQPTQILKGLLCRIPFKRRYHGKIDKG